jgi:outer membrane protein assembly factor BamA
MLFKKILIFLFFLSNINLFSEKFKGYEVGDIEVVGLKNIKEKLILKTVRAKKGKIYYEEDKKEDIENLINLGSIERASVETVFLDKEVSQKNYELVLDTRTVKVIYTIY